MTHDTQTKLTARSLRVTPAANRWQALQAQLSRQVTPDFSGWTRRSAVICKWHALPASVSALSMQRMA